MLLERIRIAGITMIVAAISLTSWKALAGRPAEASMDDSIRSVSNAAPGGRGVLTIPVEIVEAGEAPRLHEVRVTH